MPGVVNYSPQTPSPATTVTATVNDVAIPGSQFHLVSASTQEQTPVQEISTLAGLLRAVGLPTVTYQLRYVTMDAITAALTTEYVNSSPALQLEYFGSFVNNAFLVGVQIDVQEVAEGHGLLMLGVTQSIVALSQRASYAA